MEAILQQGKTPKLIPVYQERILSEPTKGVPKGYWSIFDESHSIMLLVEMNIGSVNQYDLVDGSIGSRWAKFRGGKDWAMPCSTYPHVYNDVRGIRDCKCYQLSELQHFRTWLKSDYKPNFLFDYLKTKYTKEKNVVMLDKVHHVLPRLLTA